MSNEMKGLYPATRTVHCPNGPVDCCDDHAAQLTGLMRFLGAHVVHTHPKDGAQCSNCVNEAKAPPSTNELKESQHGTDN